MDGLRARENTRKIGFRMSKRLYVGNLPYNVTEQDLLTAFAPYGATQAAVPINETGRSKGFGFVEIADDQLDAAIAAMHNSELSGRVLTVNEARPREERGGGGGYRGGGGYGGGGGGYGGGGGGYGGGGGRGGGGGGYGGGGDYGGGRGGGGRGGRDRDRGGRDRDRW
jgi:RNA recognition motif-containing protein